ncbi:hypothetical protein F2Q69_00027319 [Brassica cretica]|uniref:F-box domain-containing protein n=1 Tax=Brassica cretica TaxID=69181 RepID=A0A8S9S546_BRACR|nr:hypothetical protein F2Q69_00027319 [Brassica cretica]
MGSVMSLSCSKRKATSQDEEPSNSSRKRRKLSSLNDEEEYNCRLIPNLPDELSIQILARLPRICYSSVRLVSRRWRSAVSTSEVYALRKELGITEEWLYVLTKGQDDKLLWYALDPVSTRWQRLPPMPVIVCEEESRRSLWNLKVGEIVRSLLCRRDASEQMPFCGCAIGSVDGCLYVLGGLSKSKTVSCVWRFDPIVNSWSELINAGKILDNNRTLAESRLPVGELPGMIITMHVVLRPPTLDKKSEKLQNDPPMKNRCACTIL